jgi:archaellum component FlaC
MMSVIFSNPADRKKIKDALHEISNSMARIEGEREYIKEAIKSITDSYPVISKKVFRKMIKVYHAQTFTQEVEEHEEFENLYENITAVTLPQDSNV